MNELRSLEAWSRARPIRIAFLLEREERSHPILDDVFSTCMGMWGGRFNLVIPCDAGVPSDFYQKLMASFDPDVIYSYAELGPDVVATLTEQINPSYFVQHEKVDDSHEAWTGAFRPNIPVKPLSVSTVVPIANGIESHARKAAIKIVDATDAREFKRFVGDNFGSIRPSLMSLPAALRPIVETICVMDRQNRVQSCVTPTDVVDSPAGLLSVMAKEKKTKGLCQLSSLFAPRQFVGHSPWGEAFNLFVGDSVDDRVIYWNTRMCSPIWRDGDDVSMRVSPELFEDDSFVAALRDFLNKRNTVSRNGSSVPSVSVRSTSMSEEHLEKICASLRGLGRSWNSYTSHRSPPGEEWTSLKDIKYQSGRGAISTERAQWVDAVFLGKELRLVPPTPWHLRFAPAALLSPSEGLWGVDIDISREQRDPGRRASRWCFPKRLRITDAFLSNYAADAYTNLVPRSSDDGYLCVYANVDTNLPPIVVPDEYQAVVSGIRRKRKVDVASRDAEGAFVEAERSSSGRYFWGVLQLFAGLPTAQEFLGHKFWQTQLNRLGASNSRAESRRESIQSRITKRLGNQVFDSSDARQLEKIANIVLVEADSERALTPSVKWSDLASDFRILQDEDKRSGPPPYDDSVDWDDYERIKFQRHVQSLCGLGVLHQGFTRRCRRCYHVAWIPIGSMSATIVCQVCGETQAAPVSEPWEFRLNNFIREALRYHGIGPLFWALSKIRSHNRLSSSFWYEGPLDVYFSNESYNGGSPATDIDLTVVCDGKVRMCEVKQSVRQMKEPEVFAEIMLKLRPDIATIAIMEPFSRDAERKFARFSATLGGSGITPELLMLDDDDFEERPLF